MNSLSSCPIDILTEITAFIFGMDIGRLYLCGNSCLNISLLNGGVLEFRYIMPERLICPWPSLVSKFRSLRLFRMSGPILPPHMTPVRRWFKFQNGGMIQGKCDVPASVEVLQLAFHNAPAFLLALDLPKQFPKLRSLLCHGTAVAGMTKDFVKGLPKTLTHLTFPDSHIFRSLDLLPSEIRELNIYVEPGFTTYTPQPSSENASPSNAVDLTDLQLTLPRVFTSPLPSLHTVYLTLSWRGRIDWLAALPETISHLYLDVAKTNPRSLAWSDERVANATSSLPLTNVIVERLRLPRNLKLLWCSPYLLPSPKNFTIAFLPSSLTHLTGPGNLAYGLQCLDSAELGNTLVSSQQASYDEAMSYLDVDYTKIAPLPVSLLTLDMGSNTLPWLITKTSFLILPRWLTSLSLHFGLQEDTPALDFKDLPRTLLTLKLGSKGYQKARWDIAGLPEKIVSLTLRGLECYGSSLKLPKSLSKLEISWCNVPSTAASNEQAAEIPRQYLSLLHLPNLTKLTYSPHEHITEQDLRLLAAPSLLILKLPRSNIKLHLAPYLPQSLTSLDITPEALMNDTPEAELAEGFFRVLPPNLTSLATNFHRAPLPGSIGNMPSSITELRLWHTGLKDEAVALFPRNLRKCALTSESLTNACFKLLPPQLRHLSLLAPIDGSAAKDLPTSLRRLKLPTFKMAYFYDLPATLTYLECNTFSGLLPLSFLTAKHMISSER